MELPTVEGVPRRHHRVSDRDATRSLGVLCPLLPSANSVAAIAEVSANVSTNRVHLVRLADGLNVFAKVSNYGSPFLFREDHERICASSRCSAMIAGRVFWQHP